MISAKSRLALVGMGMVLMIIVGLSCRYQWEHDWKWKSIEPLAGLEWQATSSLMVKASGTAHIAIAALSEFEVEQLAKIEVTLPRLDRAPYRRWDTALTMIDRPVHHVYEVAVSDCSLKRIDWKDWLDLSGPFGWGAPMHDEVPLPFFHFDKDDVHNRYELRFRDKLVRAASELVIAVSQSPDRRVLAVFCAMGRREGSTGMYFGGTVYQHGPFVCEFYRASDAARIAEGKALRGCDRLRRLGAVWSPDSSVLTVVAGRQNADVEKDMLWVVPVPRTEELR